MGRIVDTLSSGTSYCINLVNDITLRNVNIITTSYAFVLIKNGRLITSANRCKPAPITAFTCNTIKYAVTIRNDPITLPNVSTCNF